MIIDFHTHIFPDRQAPTLLAHTARLFDVPTYGSATAADLLARMQRCGIERSVVHMVAPTPAAVRGTNTWLIELDAPRLYRFATLHPDMDDPAGEIARLRRHNIDGVKLQPDIQQFEPDDFTRCAPLYRALSAADLPVMLHVGGEPLPRPEDRSKPDMIARLARAYPQLRIVAAHLGGLNMWEMVAEHLVGLTNVWMETSLSYFSINPEIARYILLNHGIEKFFFGTDYPFGDIEPALAAARAVPFLDTRQKAQILGGNAHQFLAARV